MTTTLNEIELAARWGMSPKTLQRWRTQNVGPEYLKLGKKIMYPLADVEDYEKLIRSNFADIEEIYPLLESFDAADTDQTCPVRFSTTQPTQALGLLNSDFSLEQARVFAQRLMAEFPQSQDDRVRLALNLVLQRAPTAEEVHRGVNLISQFQKRDGLGPDEALSTFCLMTLNLNEFLYID